MKRFTLCLLLASLPIAVGKPAYAEPPDLSSTSEVAAPTDSINLRPVPATQALTPLSSSDPNIAIRVDDIGKVRPIGQAVTLIGRLGRPLGTKLQLRGRWKLRQVSRVPNYIQSPFRFVVFEVDGNQLAESVEFGHDQIKAEFLKWSAEDQAADPKRTNAMPSELEQLNGKEWVMTAYETGRFIAAPMEHEGKRVFPVVYAVDFNRFRSRIVGVVTSIDGEPCDETEPDLQGFSNGKSTVPTR